MLILHLIAAAEWDAVSSSGVSYAPASLEAEGFVHCSRPVQLEAVARAFYATVPDLCVLCVDTARLPATAALRFESPPDGDPNAGRRFPHVYGAIPLESVVEVVPFATERGLPPRVAWLDAATPPLDDEVVGYQTTPTWTAETVPRKLLGRHDTKAGVWGRIEVASGELLLRHLLEPVRELRVAAGEHAWVMPQAPHEVELAGDASFAVTFCRPL